MIKYRTTCPVHNIILESSDTIKETTSKMAVFRPILFCPTCQRYYLHSKQINTNPEKTTKEHKGYPIYFTSNIFTPFKEGEQSKLNKNNINRHILKTKVYTDEERVVRIHQFKEEEIDARLQTNFNNIRTLYPGLITEQMTINEFLSRVFPSKIRQKVIVRNETFKGYNNTPIRRVEICNKNSSYLRKRLPQGIYLAFGGRVTNGEFYVTEIRIWERIILKDDDIETEAIFKYDGSRRANWLYDVTNNVAKHAKHLRGELADWDTYLDWKRQLAELRICAAKYIGFRFNIKAEEVTFLIITEGRSAFDEFQKHLRRNEISIFSNNYSNNRWRFEFNRTYQDSGNNNDDGVALTFARFGDTYGINDIDLYTWDFIRQHAKKYEIDDEYLSTKQLINGIRQNYLEPYVVEVVFELSSNAMLTINRQIRINGSVTEDIEEILAGEFYTDGYIATSQIGDFTLLKRLKQAVNDLVNGKTASHGLDQWLFDIKKARLPEKIEKITDWQNQFINDKQKEAVEKILSAPDVCLIQGPPGTGKTTVIAEAIYQFVIRNKRVLVASQANLAVDNALERLISNPKIRAIRLGSAKKIDSSVSNITEENVLETFYNSILSYVNKKYIEKWDQIDEIKAEKSIKVAINREDWEDIFIGLNNWINEIPDYSQENDIFLRDFINGCNVVGVSCTENSRTLTENGFDDFDVVIIDEVSKATPPELLIPMLRGRKIVLVGDHRQLPPLFNEHEKTYQEVAELQESIEDTIVPLTMDDFNKYKDMVTASLFERYFENANCSIKETLNYQYRMHSDIMDIINIFYDNQLKDGNKDNYTYDTKAHYLDICGVSGIKMIVPTCHSYWFDSSEVLGEKIYEQRKPGSTSAENLVEAEIIMELLRKIELQYANLKDRNAPVSVGIISFYYDQVVMIRQMLRVESFHAIDVEINTVDRFQGKEKEIIFVSLVRNTRRSTHNIDSHIAAFQRINVAFSRAQNLLIIVGAKDMYIEQPVKITDMNNGEERIIMAYKEIIEMLDQRGAYITSDEVLTDVKAYDILQQLNNMGGNEA